VVNSEIVLPFLYYYFTKLLFTLLYTFSTNLLPFLPISDRLTVIYYKLLIKVVDNAGFSWFLCWCR
jgi:hypothetical protein